MAQGYRVILEIEGSLVRDSTVLLRCAMCCIREQATLLSRHMTSKQRRINVDATSSMLLERCFKWCDCWVYLLFSTGLTQEAST